MIAAKGLIRFPELQAKRDDSTSVDGVGIDAVTEYFLVGSFVSWLVALGSPSRPHTLTMLPFHRAGKSEVRSPASSSR